MLQYAYRDFMRMLASVVSSLCNYQMHRWRKMKEGGGREDEMGEMYCDGRKMEGIKDE